MNLLSIVKKLEGLSNQQRFEVITEMLTEWELSYTVQEYATGKNIIVNSEGNKKIVGVSSHFDVVHGSPGANDNGTAVAVCLHTLHKLKTHSFKNFGVSVFFFDEEEYGLKGSKAYVQKHGIDHFIGVINIEMVGQGDKFALWQVNEQSKGVVMETFEATAANLGFYTRRFDKIVTNTSDQMSFLHAGLEDVFSLTLISDMDLQVAYNFYMAQAKGADIQTLESIMDDAPLFKHYHKPTDLAIHLNEESLQTASRVIWETLVRLDES
jgi:Zn-dependent M28 family amino/carboxypeptidase